MNIKILKFPLLLILPPVLLLACDAQNQIELPATTVPTITRTPTPHPSSTPTAISESFASYTSQEIGLSLKYPSDWLVTDDPEAIDLPSGDAFEFTAITLASDPGLKRSDAASFESGQGFIVVFFADGKGIDFPPEMLPDLLQNIPIYLPPDKEAPKMVTLNGKQFAIAAYDVANHGIPYPNFVAATSFGDKLVYSFVFTSVANEDEFRFLFEQVLSTIEYSEK